MGFWADVSAAIDEGWTDTRAALVNSWAEGREKIGDVGEYFTGSDQQTEQENGGLTGTSGTVSNPSLTGKKPINWTAAGVIVGAVGILIKVVGK